MCCALTDLAVKLDAQKHDFIYDMTSNGWSLVNGEEGPARSIEPATLRFSTFLDKDNSYVSGEEMLRQSVENVLTLGSLAGQHQIERLLGQQNQIPPELREYNIITLATVWQDQEGNRYIPSLDWSVWQWVLHFYRLNHGKWCGHNLVARLPLADAKTEY